MILKKLFIFAIFCLNLSIVKGKRFYITSSGVCMDCGFKGENYQWCDVGYHYRDWDYCSTKPGYSSKGKACKYDHQCDYHGKGYLWCYLNEGSWDRCSWIEDTDLLQLTTYGDECQNYCDLEGGQYVCRNKDKYSIKCSPVNGIAAHGAQCKGHTRDDDSNYNYNSYYLRDFCGIHGDNTYMWCYTNDNSWGYCSPIKSDNSFGRKKRTISRVCDDVPGTTMTRINIYERLEGNGYRIVTGVYAENPNPNHLQPVFGSSLVDAQFLIYRWNAGRSSDVTISGATMQSNRNIRLQRQGIIQTENYGYFVNYQLQRLDRNPISVIAQVNIPSTLVGYGDERYRRMLVYALYESVDRAEIVWVLQQRVSPNGDFQCLRYKK